MPKPPYALWLSAALLGVSISAHSFAVKEKIPSPRLVVVSFNGQIQVKAPVGPKQFNAQAQTPVIPPGSEITILSGRAIFQSGGVFIRANAGDSFLYHVPLPAGGNARPVLLIGLGENTSAQLDVGDIHAIIRSNTAISVRPDGPGHSHVEVHMGKVVVSTPEEIASLSPGMWVRGTLPTSLSDEAGLEALALPQAERDELRSAPGPRPSTAAARGGEPPGTYAP
ncbi:MAG: hypothetical protein HY925_06575 [Elusimicrobia bacterium]|nr:hypothetical protein [Elusimicrobiota bacterium]